VISGARRQASDPLVPGIIHPSIIDQDLDEYPLSGWDIPKCYTTGLFEKGGVTTRKHNDVLIADWDRNKAEACSVRPPIDEVIHLG
jgi:hypothetical protein